MNVFLDMLLHGWEYAGLVKVWDDGVVEVKVRDDGVVEVKVQHRVPYGEWIEL